MDQQNKKNTGKKCLLFFLILLMVLIVAALIWYGIRYFSRFDPSPYKAETADTPTSTEAEPETEPVSEPETELPPNPIDFDALMEKNPDVCAWITVPNTNIDYPILQSSDANDDFYLNHGLDGQWDGNGSIYIQRLNNNQFLDRNTVIYGHNMLNGSMFRTLHYFRDPDFFNANEFFTIYLPGHILTYRIFSAYRYDNRHILRSFDFSDTEVYRDYLNFATNPTSLIRNVREGVEVTTDDRIVTLSTCIGSQAYRYLVQGVLIDDQPTT